MEVQQNKKYIAPAMRFIILNCTEDNMVEGEIESTSIPREGGAKQHTSFSSWDDEEEAED